MNSSGRTPRFPEVSGYQVRPLVLDDVDAVYALLAQSPEEDASDPPTHQSISRTMEKFGERLQTDSLTIVAEDEAMVAVALVFLPPASGDEEVANVLGVVQPDHHGPDLGMTLLGWMEARARQEISADPRLKRLRTRCDLGSQARVRLFERYGFKPVRYSFEMQARLGELIQEPKLSFDLAVIPWRSDLSEPARRAFNVSFAGHWGLPEMNTAMWERSFVGVPQFRADLSWLAMRGDDLVGVCINWVNPEEGDVPPTQGWIEAIGVAPEFRGQGVADAMIIRSLNGFLEEGLSQVALDVDTQNLTGALQLYEKHGFTPSRRTAIFEKPLD